MIKEDLEITTASVPSSLGARFGALGLGALLLATPSLAQMSQPENIEEFLAETVGLSAREITRLKRRPLVKEVPVQNRRREYAIFAGIRIDATRDAVIKMLEKPENLKHPGVLLQFGRFGDHPSVEDLAELEVTGDDLEILADCVPGNCRLKANREFLERVPYIDWAAEDVLDVLTSEFREGMVAYVEDYLERGADALLVYGDKRESQSVAKESEMILDHEADMYDFVPELTDYLKAFPSGSLEDATDIMYWTVEDYGYGLNPVTQIVHLTGYEPGQGVVAIVERQILANRYFHARMNTITLVPDPEGGGTYVFYADRALFDSNLSGIMRGLLGIGVRRSADRWLNSLKSLVERS